MFICSHCLFQRPMKDKKQIQDHHRYHHSMNKSSKLNENSINIPHLPSDLSLSDIEIYSNSSLSVFNEDSDLLPSKNSNFNQSSVANSSTYNSNWQISSLCNELNSSSKMCTDRFTKNSFEYWLQQNLSLEYLMASSCFHQNDNIKDICHSDAEMNTQMFEFINTLKRSQQIDFSNLMKHYIDPHISSWILQVW